MLTVYKVMCLWEGEQLTFYCNAEDDEHAVEQCENAYPGCVVTHLAIAE